MTMSEAICPDNGATRAPGRPRHIVTVTCLLLMLAAWVEYLPTLKYGFVDYDDDRILETHPELYGQASLADDCRAIFTTHFPREEPLLIRDVSWAVDSRIFGFGNPFGYHLTNVTLHGLVVALLYLFLLTTTRRHVFSTAVAAGYLILGIHTEAVTWIMGRKDLLSTFFMLLALCAQTRRLTASSRSARWGWYVLTLAAFVGGVLSKISVLSFPGVLFLHALLLPYLRGERPANAPFIWGRHLVRELGLLVPALILTGWIFVWYDGILVQAGIYSHVYKTRGTAHLWNLLMVDPLVFWVYVRQTFFPRHFWVFYSWPALAVTYPAWQIAGSLGTVAAIIGTGVWLFRRHKDLFFYFAAFFIIMVPYSNLQYMGIWVAERYLYFSSFCLVALAVTAGAKVLSCKQSWVRISVLTVVLSAAAINLYQTFSYQPVWRDGATLRQYDLVYTTDNPSPYVNLAQYYYLKITPQTSPEETQRKLQQVTTLVDAGLSQFWPDRRQPPPPETYFLFFLQSLVEEMNGQPEKALDSLLMSDRLRPHYDATCHNLAQLYHKLSGLTDDPAKRTQYANAARERFMEYVQLAFPNQPLPPEVQKELVQYQTASSTTNQNILKEIQPSPAK